MLCKCDHPGIVPGMTFTQRWLLPVPAYLVSSGHIVYEQLGKKVLDIDFTGAEEIDYRTCAIPVEMTQERSLSFAELYPAEAQINFLTPSGGRIVTEPTQLEVGRNMDMEVMPHEQTEPE